MDMHRHYADYDKEVLLKAWTFGIYSWLRIFLGVIQLLKVIIFTLTHSYLSKNENRQYQSKKSGMKMKQTACMKLATNAFLSGNKRI